VEQEAWLVGCRAFGQSLANGSRDLIRMFARLFGRRSPALEFRFPESREGLSMIVAATPAAMTGLSEASLAIWKRLNGQRIVVATCAARQSPPGVGVLAETERFFANWLRDNEIEAAIVRPDRHVFGGARNSAELNALIGELAILLRL